MINSHRSSSFVGSEGNLWETAEFWVILFFSIDVVVINFDKLGKVASKWNPNPDLDLDT